MWSQQKMAHAEGGRRPLHVPSITYVLRAALNVFMSNRFSDSLPDSTLLGISDVELYRELLGGAD